jgi:hypothetical protein
MDGVDRDMTDMERRRMHIGFLWENQKEIDD